MSTLLDTNVLSELMRSAPDPAVVAWISAQPADSIFVAAVTEAEMRLGARLLPAGKRRRALEGAIAALFEEDFSGRIRSFDTQAVPHYVDVVAKRRAAGRPISQFDAQIAAIALSHGDKLATRNSSDFEGSGVSIVDPWQLILRTVN